MIKPGPPFVSISKIIKENILKVKKITDKFPAVCKIKNKPLPKTRSLNQITKKKDHVILKQSISRLQKISHQLYFLSETNGNNPDNPSQQLSKISSELDSVVCDLSQMLNSISNTNIPTLNIASVSPENIIINEAKKTYQPTPQDIAEINKEIEDLFGSLNDIKLPFPHPTQK
ncbi:hypothetical protein RFI_06929 [Reticulomyxa filosa]|uniref:Uncharacterized protein n=1 Tax=Reticulomyxa filosa TaxID=46433 RepID=X6NWD0_RETFI|nr:hypothetical protein RFI_06929 [Reticulomyxa filosa]|eukprot:ETO30188.1 hypothetical protein RFI_06929 [Reticulomyxa filosa]